MNNKVIKIKLYIKSDSKIKKIANEIQKEFIKNGFKITDNNYDIAISIGGDGTFLKMIHENEFNDNIMYYGINAGALGFLTDIEKDELEKIITGLKEKLYKRKKISFLKTSIYTNSNIVDIYSFNEIVIKRSDSSLLKSPLYIDNELLEKYTGDGLLISTSLGSTAYNLSFNGPIIDNELNIFTLTPMAPVNNSLFKSLNNSIVLSKNRKILIKLDKKQNMLLINDGKIVNINDINKIVVSLSDKYINLITVKNNDFITKINCKIIGK